MSLCCRRVFIPFAIILLSLAGIALAATESPVKYSKVRVYITSKEDIHALSQAGVGLDHIDYQVTYIDAVLNNQELAVLGKTGRPHEILIDDMEAEYRKRPIISPKEIQELEKQMREKFHAPSGFGYGSMGGYYTFTEVLADLDEMRSLYPNLISAPQPIGYSLEGRAIWMVKVSDNPDIDEGEPEILYTGLHHAREPQSMATLMYFMWYLLENFGNDVTATALVNNRELHFVPVVNPDGYVYNQQTNPGGGGMWRKNRRNNGDGSFGIDLNRNYGYQWGYDNNGSSPFTWSETYRGPGPFSEIETQVMRDFAISRQFISANNYHSWGNYVIFPWGYIPNFDTPDQATFVALADDMTQFNNYIYGHANQTVGYVVNGEANDWHYGEQIAKGKTFAFTTEVGNSSDYFWPPISRIYPLAQENIHSNLVLAATGPCPTISVSPSALPNGSFGEPYNQTLTPIGAAAPYTFALTGGSLPAGLTLNPATGVISGTPTTVQVANFEITVTDFFGCAGSQSYTIVIEIVCPAITLGPATLPNGQAGVPYNQTVTVAGGTAPYNFVITSGTLPAGLTLDPATGIISGTPAVQGPFGFTIMATDSMGCSGEQSYGIEVLGLCDVFDDDVMSTNWTYLKPAWTESGGYLSGIPAARKAIAIATPAFSNCEICDIQTGIRFAMGLDTRIWVLTHYNDKRNTMELLFKEATDKVVLRQRVNGSIVKKTKAAFTLNFNVDYDVGLTFDGTQVAVTIDGTPLISFTPVGSLPSGSVGFQIKNGTGAFDYLCMN